MAKTIYEEAESIIEALDGYRTKKDRVNVLACLLKSLYTDRAYKLATRLQESEHKRLDLKVKLSQKALECSRLQAQIEELKGPCPCGGTGIQQATEDESSRFPCPCSPPPQPKVAEAVSKTPEPGCRTCASNNTCIYAGAIRGCWMYKPKPKSKVCGSCRESETCQLYGANIYIAACPYFRPKITCRVCNDTHYVETERGRRHMCTSCPLPCTKCGGGGPFCKTTPCSCDCHKKKEN